MAAIPITRSTMGATPAVKSSVTHMVLPDQTTPTPMAVNSGLIMLAKCSGLFSNADSRDPLLGPVPTFSPPSVHPAGSIEARLPLWDRKAAAAIFPDHQVARPVSRVSTVNGAKPRAARRALIGPTNAMASDRLSARADGAATHGATIAAANTTVATSPVILLEPSPRMNG